MALKGNQKKLDKNNNNRIDAQDFKILKAEKAKGKKVGGEIKKDPTKPVNPFEKRRKKLMGIKQAVGKAGRLGAVGTAVGAAAVGAKKLIDKIKEKKNKKMGGGMMQRPMGYKAGTMIKARGGGMARSKPTKMY